MHSWGPENDLSGQRIAPGLQATPRGLAVLRSTGAIRDASGSAHPTLRRSSYLFPSSRIHVKARVADGNPKVLIASSAT